MWKKTKALTKDLRPVFPEERLLLEILIDKKPNEFIKNSVWAVNNRYYIDGKSISISNATFQNELGDSFDFIDLKDDSEQYSEELERRRLDKTGTDRRYCS